MLGIYTPADSIYLLIEGIWGRRFGEGREGSDIQGGSDKSGIFKIFLENHTAQLKIIRF
jgi:hypothetical protein